MSTKEGWSESYKGRLNRWRFTGFVDNLLQNLNRYGLKGIFRKAGNVSDLYMLAKQERSSKRNGFVRFWKEEEALNSILLLNSTIIRGSRIRVCMARYGKGGIGKSAKKVSNQSWMPKVTQKARKMWSEKVPQANKVESNHMEQDATTTLEGETNVNFMEWLTRSVVCESKESRDLKILSKALVNDDC